MPSLLRGFSAPVRLEADLSEADLLALVAHDEDSFNRWQASQTLAIRLMTRSVTAIRAGLPPLFEPAYAGALLHLLDGADEDAAFVAQGLTLPGEADLAREIGRDVDPEAIHTAREALRKDLGLALGDRLRTLYDDLSDPHPYAPEARPAGRRALRNIALDLLTAGDIPGGTALAQAQFATASNMTTRSRRSACSPVYRGRPATRLSQPSTRASRTTRSSSTNGSLSRRCSRKPACSRRSTT